MYMTECNCKHAPDWIDHHDATLGQGSKVKANWLCNLILIIVYGSFVMMLPAAQQCVQPE